MPPTMMLRQHTVDRTYMLKNTLICGASGMLPEIFEDDTKKLLNVVMFCHMRLDIVPLMFVL
jgi:hypothetical protein